MNRVCKFFKFTIHNIIINQVNITLFIQYRMKHFVRYNCGAIEDFFVSDRLTFYKSRLICKSFVNLLHTIKTKKKSEIMKRYEQVIEKASKHFLEY